MIHTMLMLVFTVALQYVNLGAVLDILHGEIKNGQQRFTLIIVSDILLKYSAIMALQ